MAQENLNKVSSGVKRLLNDMALKEVKSSRMKAIGYMASDENKGIVIIEFNNPKGSRYIYYDVPKKTYNELKHAESIGKAFSQLISDKFEYERIS